MKKLGYLLTGIVLGATLFGGAQAAADGILAQRSSAPFFLNGSPVEVETYLIHNNHFFSAPIRGRVNPNCKRRA